MGAKKKSRPAKTELEVSQRALAPKGKGAHAKDPETGLTANQEIFARLYARSNNVAQAFIEAGYSDAGSPSLNSQAAYRVMVNPNVLNRVEFWRKRFDQLLDVEDRRVILEVAAICLSDPGLLFDVDTNEPLAINDIPERMRRAISGVKRTRNNEGQVTWEYKLWDKTKALELLGQIKGMMRAKSGAKALVKIKTEKGEIEVSTTLRSEG